LIHNTWATRNLKREFICRGIDPGRVIFAARKSVEDHLARHNLADIFLDTLPCNAHTTASDALWTGLPVITQIGEAFAGRVAASLLTAVGLSELIAKTKKEYEELAVELGRDPVKLKAIQSKLETRFSTPLFDTPRLARAIEKG